MADRRWSVEQVLALAPDPASGKAGRSQASAGKWPLLGASPEAVWGACQGSGKTPYQTVVELSGPAFRCSCPSRKFPCKHALGLLLLWAGGSVEETDTPESVRTWLGERADRARQAEERTRTPVRRDPAAAAKRAEQRTDRVAGGVAELSVWLADQVRRGLSALERGGRTELGGVAARMVDAQAPGPAGVLRRAARLVGRGKEWPARLLEEFALLHLLTEAFSRLASHPEPLADTVRARLGFVTETAEVRENGERVADVWLVAGLVDDEGDQLVSRRVWLWGKHSGRYALVLSFAPPGRPLDFSLLPGSQVSATVAFYPGALPLRALVLESGEPVPAPCPAGDSVEASLEDYAAALASDPWLERWPVVLSDVVPARLGEGWGLSDVDGLALPLAAETDPFPLLAVSGGAPLTVAAEWSAAGLRPLSCWDGERPVLL
ncbi:MAG: hypothetical protein JWQ81_4920 [Amycolatopsis sp.]|uniref:SWIM zinc finger family protein n=1 Tax=Amycolatopsis sp. TaxID=37632 RepID=UPI0026021451|nr:SWIM zinc finger family protein [Amycolatopsis sp.]MCU1684181.1 hypothetical protein [Amycolatopsis sp.]